MRDGGGYGVPFSSWMRGHAAWMLAASLTALVVRRPEGAGVLALLSFGAWLSGRPGVFAAHGRLETANLVTALRLLLVVGLGALPLTGGAVVLAALAFLLDGVDGWIARRRGQTSPLGALFDTEVDALWVLQLCLLLHLRAGLPVWVLLAGLWRYGFVLGTIVVRPLRAPRARTRAGRWFFFATALLLMAALLLGGKPAWALAATANLVVSVSFLRSIWQTYAPARRVRQGPVAST